MNESDGDFAADATALIARRHTDTLPGKNRGNCQKIYN
jgi:hypothetical protein